MIAIRADRREGTTLLAVDDRQDNLFVLEQLITDGLPGCRVITAGSAREGLALAASVHVDGAVIDVQMPGVDGLEMCRRLKADPATRHVHVILITAHEAGARLRARGLDAGADDFVDKPVDNAELIARIRAMLRVQRAEAGLRRINEHLDELVAERTRALRDSEARYRELYQEAPHAYVTVEARRGVVTACNRAAAELLGLAPEQLRGREVTALVADTPQARAAAADVLERVGRGEAVTDAELPLQRAGGDVVDVSLSLRPRADAAGAVVEYRCIAVDVTERRRLEAQVAQADRLASMGLLAAGVAHEINNPLTYVLGGLEALAEDLPRCAALGDGAARDEALAEILAGVDDALRGIHQIRDIVQALGTFSRVEQDQLTPVDPARAARNALTMARNELKYRARVVEELGEVPPVLATEGRLAQVVLNLLINAAHAVEAADPGHHEVAVRTWAEGDEVCLAVRDTGAGIAADDLARVFEPFYSTKEVGSGSGLGLPICRSIVEGFGGTIGIASTVGAGTRVTVRLPAHRAPAAAAERPEAPAATTAAPAERGRILVIDDEPAVRRALRRALRGHDVVAAASGVEARELLAADRDFDVVFCDMMMPRLSGMELHAWLAEQDRGLAQRLVFVTGGAFTPEARDYVRREGVPCLQKPFELAPLRGLVRDRLGTRRG